jgi:ubiquitin-like-conjugating enzyme ATG3
VESTYDDEVLIDKIDLLELDEKSVNSFISVGNSVNSPTKVDDSSPKNLGQNTDLKLEERLSATSENKDLLNMNEKNSNEIENRNKDKADEYSDMEDETLALDESTTNSINTKIGPGFSVGYGIVRSRRYDVSITYDKYYQTPRVWLFGYDENGSPLKPESIFDDIMQDYAKKTVTIDPHPHLSRPHASIHPCQHGPAMLRIVIALHECGNVPVVDSYLFIFLKFIQSIIPTIEYDYTMDVRVRGGDR